MLDIAKGPCDKPTLVLLVGNIGAGKSTLTKELANQGYLILSRDSIRYMIGGGEYRFGDETEPIVRSVTLAALEVMAIAEKHVVLDETSMSPRIRSTFINVVKRYDYNVIAIILPKLSMEESVARRLRNPHGQPDKALWERVWTMFDHMYVEPSKKEGIHQIIKL